MLFILFRLEFSAQVSRKVIRIKDGDKVLFLLAGNIRKTLRSAEVDCPENGQAFRKNARKFTSNQIFEKQINFIATDTDK